jgi:hypothetical protein
MIAGVVVVMVFAVLAVAPSAWAACVWVLWSPTSAQQRGAVGDWSHP